MLAVPRSLLALWSDYEPAALDPEAFLNAYLDSGLATPVNLDLRGILRNRIESVWTRTHLRKALGSLCSWCVAHERYFHNVVVSQNIERDDAGLICTPLDLAARSRLAGAKLPCSVVGQSGNRYFSVVRVRPSSLARISGPLKPWSTAHSLHDGDLVLVDAPILAPLSEEGTPALSLSDYPGSLLHARDACVPLHASTSVVNSLRAVLDGSEWHPFCRTLGVVLKEGRGDCIQVLQIYLRAPLYGEPTWAVSLIAEASAIEKWKTGKTWFGLLGSFELDASSARKQHPGLDDLTLTQECSADLAPVLVDNLGANYSRFIEEQNSPYAGVNAFWTALSTILSAWRDRLPLTRSEVRALLREFDATYDNEWREHVGLLALSGVLRFTPAVMASVRSKIAALDGRSDAVT